MTLPTPTQEYEQGILDAAAEVPGELEWFNGKLTPVVNADRIGWYRFHDHYDRDGYCDNPARGY